MNYQIADKFYNKKLFSGVVVTISPNGDLIVALTTAPTIPTLIAAKGEWTEVIQVP